MNATDCLVLTSFGTLGPVQRQVRQLLNATHIPTDADCRPAAFCLANATLNGLPAELPGHAWMLLEEDHAEDNPVLVLASAARGVALCVAVNLADRAPLSALLESLGDNSIELLVASPGGTSTHRLKFSRAEAAHLEGLATEFLDIAPEKDPDWMHDFGGAVPRLPALCAHLTPTLYDCSRHLCLILQGSSEDHLRAVQLALRRSVGV